MSEPNLAASPERDLPSAGVQDSVLKDSPGLGSVP
jgi:hypothetical protein